MLGHDLPLDGSNDNSCLKSVAAGIVADVGLGNHSSHGDPATEPEGHGNKLHGGNHEFVREARQPERGETQVGHSDNESPAAIEEHEIDDIRERPFIVQGGNDYGQIVSRSHSFTCQSSLVGTNCMQSSQ